MRDLQSKALHSKRHTDYVRYSGTKHDGSRRTYGTPNPISYFHVANFIAEHWPAFEAQFGASPFSVSRPKIGKEDDDRPVIMQSLSELTSTASRQLSYASHILRADVAQFFPSIYTHAISWAAHGIEQAKADTSTNSAANPFNRLDLFVRNCQQNESRGLMIGPDAFRLVAEFIMARLDGELHAAIGESIVGAARHVDDYYIGIKDEAEILFALSQLRESLQRYGLQLNDAKTRTMSGVEPLNELWAQELRQAARKLDDVFGDNETEDFILFLNKALSVAKAVGSDSPVKVALRAFDQIRLYNKDDWTTVEPYLQRLMFHHPHAIDYTALLVVKRVARGKLIDENGWQGTAYQLISRHLAYNHHHEVVWLLWLLISIGADVSDQLSTALVANENAHIRAMLIAAYCEGRLKWKPSISLGSKLATTDSAWLTNLVGRVSGYTGAPFAGELKPEFEHLASKRFRLIDFDAHLKAEKKKEGGAISRTRYGYDSEPKARGRRNPFDDAASDPDDDDLDDDDEPSIDELMRAAMARDNS